MSPPAKEGPAAGTGSGTSAPGNGARSAQRPGTVSKRPAAKGRSSGAGAGEQVNSSSDPGPRTAVVPAPQPGTDSTPKEARWQRDETTPTRARRVVAPSTNAEDDTSADRHADQPESDDPSADEVGPDAVDGPASDGPASDGAGAAKSLNGGGQRQGSSTADASPADTRNDAERAAPAPAAATTTQAPVSARREAVSAPTATRTAVHRPTEAQPATPATKPAAAPDDADDGSLVVESRRRLGRRERFRARRVRRLVRHVDPWSVFKLSLVLNVCMWFIFLVAGVTMWSVARSSGTIENFEKFIAQSFSLTDVSIDADLLFRVYSLIGLIITLALTGAAVIGSILFNLISDLIGGVWVSVIEEESAEPV
ncbi:MAG: DUF3566 domain-containing protein [Microthrixaceae bacterium]